MSVQGQQAVRRRRVAGFTLVELLVASAVFSVIAVLLAGVTASVTTLSSQATARLDAVRLAREVFDLFGRDFTQTAVTRPSLGTSNALQFCVNPSQVTAAYTNPTALFWQSAVSRDRTAGNIAVVGYFVQKIVKPAAGGVTAVNRSQLRRVLIEPTDPLYLIYSAPDNWLPVSAGSDTLQNFVNAGTDSTNVDRGWVADGVLGLWVRCLDANGEVITKNGVGVGADQGYAFNSRLGFRSGSAAAGFVHNGINALPSSVDIGLVCVAPRDSLRIVSLPLAANTVPSSFTVPANLEADMSTYLAEFNRVNPQVKSGLSMIRRFRVR